MGNVHCPTMNIVYDRRDFPKKMCNNICEIFTGKMARRGGGGKREGRLLARDFFEKKCKKNEICT